MDSIAGKISWNVVSLRKDCRKYDIDTFVDKTPRRT
jgi:hypothetical protein